MCSPPASSYSSFSSFINLEITWFDGCLKFQQREVMDHHTFGEIFESDALRRARLPRSSTSSRPSYNEDLITPRFGDEGDERDAHPSAFPCQNFLRATRILNDCMTLVRKAGLTSYMQDESAQYALLTKEFVESFSFTNSMFKPSVSYKIYGRDHSMTLKKFCKALGLGTTGSSKKIAALPADPLELYRGITNDDDRRAQRGKIKIIQLPAIRYFAYYLTTSVLGRENTSNISNYQLAFLATVLNNEDKYNLGSLIARRLAAKGPIYGGIIATRIAAALDIAVDPHDIVLV